MTRTDIRDRLALADELLLLALDDESGDRTRSTELEPALGGALLLDLALRRRVGVADHEVVVLDASPTGDSLLDSLLARIRGERPRSAKHWVVAAQKGVRAVVGDRLVAAGVLRREGHRAFGLFPVTRLPSSDPVPEAGVRARLDDVVLRGDAADERTAALAALVHVTGLQKTIYPHESREDRRTTKARLSELAEGEWAPTAVRGAVQDIQTTLAAVVISVTMTGTS